MDEIFRGLKTDDFINELPSGLKTSVYTLVSRGFSYEQIGKQMSENPSLGLAAKGGDKWNEDLFTKVIGELKEILCTDQSKHSELRNKLFEETNNSARAVTALVSGWVGSNIGVTAAVCVPFVILSLASILKAGLSVFCVGKVE